MSKATIRWFDRNIDEVEQRIYRSESPIDPDNLPTPLAVIDPNVEVYEDETVEVDKLYYYRVSSVRVDGLERVSDEITVDTAYNLGPGSDVLVGGGAAAGFFGEVPVTELFTGDELASLIRLSTGRSQHSSQPWLKFVIDGEIIYVAKRPYRDSISWNNIRAVNAVYNNEYAPIVEKGGYQFRVTLMTGASSDPATRAGGEWNRLMHRVHRDDPSGNPWARYTNADIVVGSGNGRATWTQETSDANSSSRVHRGSSSIDYYATRASGTVFAEYGWRPVLRLIV